MTRDHFDYVLVGGGLQNGLLALALADRQPGASVALVERSAKVAGNHTWCFHAQDVPSGARAIVDPLVAHRWSGYEVRFPNRRRQLSSEYACIPSARLAGAIEELAASSKITLLRSAEAVEVGERQVRLADGRVLHARLVVDSRGPGTVGPSRTGYQKFFGLELELDAPHGVERPILMDATVPQLGGFRFLYTLPLGPRRLLLEDTYFTRDPSLDEEAAREFLLTQAARAGYRVASVVREETGVLPMPWEHELPEPHTGPLVGGYAGGWFHPATGYSFPIALRLALLVADTDPSALFGPALRTLYDEHRSQTRFAMFLNSMLFRFFEPEQMWNVLERFYRLPEPLIDRFYAHRMTASDRARVLVGRPPRGMSLRAAAQALRSAP